MAYPGRFFYPYVFDQPCFTPPYGYPYGYYLLSDSKEPEKKSAILKPVTTQPVLTQAQIDEITAYINNYRVAHQAPPLAWDATISQFAQKWSAYLLNNNLFQHSGSLKYGENLAYFKGYGTDVMTLLKLSVDMWYNEVKLYDFKKPGFSHETGHFTALVWKSSTSFGMGISINPDTGAADITMNLSPPGNVVGEFDKNVLEALAPVVIPPTTPTPTTIVPEQPPPPAVPSPNNNLTLKADIIHSLYNLINEVNKNKSKEMIAQDISKIIINIVNL